MKIGPNYPAGPLKYPGANPDANPDSAPVPSPGQPVAHPADAASVGQAASLIAGLAAKPKAAAQNAPASEQEDDEFTNTVTVVGGGVAGLVAACALAGAGFRVKVLERRGYLGGRASSYTHPGTGEVIDNCQHVLFGCCTNLIAFYQRIGVLDRIYWTNSMTMIEPGGRRSVLGASWLPAPLHGIFSLLGARCFSLADKLSLALAFGSLLLGPEPDPDGTLFDWLEAHVQSERVLNRFWKLVVASALNADLDQIGMVYADKVIRELFFNSPAAGSMGMSRVPISQLYSGAVQYCEERRGGILYNSNVEAAEWNEEDRLWTVKTGKGDAIVSEHLVLALPFEGLAKLIPRMPHNDSVAPLREQIAKLEHWPICSVHLWFDRVITDLDHAVLLDGHIHWMYHKSRWQQGRDAKQSYVELVISASKEFAALKAEQAIELAKAQLAEYFPAVHGAALKKSVLTKEVRATFGVPPRVDAIRPSAISPWPNCYLAGDWTATGWPSTMESAARSGNLAAEALCRSLGDLRPFLAPDLKPTGLMSLLR